MALVSFPTSANSIYSTRQISHSLQFISHQSRNTHISPTLYKNSKKTANNNVFGNLKIYRSFSSRHRDRDRDRGLLVVPFNAKINSEAAGDDRKDPRALETVLRLYTAIKNKNIHQLSEIIGDECQCVCNLFSAIQPIQGKKQVLDFFSYLIRSLGNNIEFVVRPTLHDGMNVGIQWSLEWNKTHVPLGKGFSFHICQVYKGKVIIRNVEMFMEPLLHIEPLRLKMMGIMTAVMDKMGSNAVFKSNANRVVWIFLFLFIKVVFIIVLKLLLH